MLTNTMSPVLTQKKVNPRLAPHRLKANRQLTRLPGTKGNIKIKLNLPLNLPENPLANLLVNQLANQLANQLVNQLANPLASLLSTKALLQRLKAKKLNPKRRLVS